jgi:hypothetical protein
MSLPPMTGGSVTGTSLLEIVHEAFYFSTIHFYHSEPDRVHLFGVFRHSTRARRSIAVNGWRTIH